MKKILLFAIAASMVACAPAVPTYTIIGEAVGESNEGKEIYLKSVSTGKALDTTIIKNGKFMFTGDLHCPEIASLAVQGIRYSPKLVLEQDTIIVELKETGGVTVSGTPLNEVLQNINSKHAEIRGEFMKKYEALKVLYKNDEKKLKAEVTKLNNEEFSGPLEKIFKDALNNNRTNVLGMELFLNSFIGNFKSVDSIKAYIVEYPAAADFQPIKKALKEFEIIENTSAGKMFTDFAVRNIENTKDVKLSDYVGKGNYVLLDFWASWCGPCKKEMPHLAELQAKYAKKGLVVLSVNVWDTHEKALKSIKDWKMTWAQIYDATGKAATDLYAVPGIPTIILFAPDGEIVYRSHGGSEMIEFVEKTMDAVK